MLINPDKDKTFRLLMEFLLSFDFPNKEVIQNQIAHSVICKDRSEYHVAFNFFVDTKQRSLPKTCNGVFILIQIKTDCSLTCCELYVSNQYVAEFRVLV